MKKNNCDNCELQIHCKARMLIAKERASQDDKWGIQEHTDEWWLTILMEEVGELSREILEIKFGDGDHEKLVNELIQVAAVAKAWLECKKRDGIGICKFHMVQNENM